MNPIEEAFIAHFGGWLCYAMPDSRYVYHHRGEDYLLEAFVIDPETVMKNSLEEGKNLVIKTFPKVDLFPDPNVLNLKGQTDNEIIGRSKSVSFRFRN